MKIRINDKVKVISGKDKGKISKVLRVLNAENKVVVEGVNLVKKNIKPNKDNDKGGVVELEKPVDVSNVMYYNESLKKAVRVGYKILDGKKVRICKKSGSVLDSKGGEKAHKSKKEAISKDDKVDLSVAPEENITKEKK